MALPPSAKTPAFMQTIGAIANPLGMLESLSQELGDIFVTHLSGYPATVIISDPIAVKQVFEEDPSFFQAEQNPILLNLLGESSVILMSGKKHKERRKLLIPLFTRKEIESHTSNIWQLAVEKVNQWQPDAPINILSFAQNFTLDIILKLLFGGQYSPKFSNIINNWVKLFNSPSTFVLLMLPLLQKDLGSWSPWGDFIRKKQAFDNAIYELIANFKQHKDPDTVLARLMTAKDEHGLFLNNDHLRDELTTGIFGGYESTASTLCWATYWTHRYPQIREKLHQELISLGDNPNPADILRLPYLTAVCSETLRITPPLSFTSGRQLINNYTLKGYSLQPEMMLLPCIHLIHHRSDLYPDPETFKPERFLNSKFSFYEYLPFGGGNRGCLGTHLALVKIKLAIAAIILYSKRELKLSAPFKPKRKGIVMSPPTSLTLCAEI